MNAKDIMSLIFAGIGAFTTMIVSIGGAYVVLKVTLATNSEKIDRIEQDIEEIKEERKELHREVKEMLLLLNKVYNKVGILDERTQKI